MKYTKYIYILFFVFALLTSCEEVTEKPSLGDGNAPELLSPDGSLSYVFTEENAESPFETFIYSAATFNQPIVTDYVIEIADGSDDAFETKFDMQEATSQLYQSISIKDFNLLMGSAGLNVTPEVPTTVNVRVRAGNANDSVQVLYSNVIKLDITPYDAVIPPIYILGSATDADWNPGTAIPLESISADEYSATVQINATGKNGEAEGTFRFKDNNTDWGGTNWHYSHMTKIESTEGYEFSASSDGDDNFAVSQSGLFEIVFNKTNLTVKFTLKEE